MVVTKLMKYVKQECAQYVHYYSTCLFGECPCLLSEGKRCPYFERVLIPIAGQQGVANKVIEWYDGDAVDTRACPDCGAELAYRKRYCPKCARKRKRRRN